jgi:very-short-patch-repair endonuclease
MTLPEVVLWQALRGRRLEGLRFRRQHPIGPYALDFYCPSARLAIEVDGAAHDGSERAVRDAQRDARLRERAIRVLRFAAADVLDDTALDDILQTIVATATVG